MSILRKSGRFAARHDRHLFLGKQYHREPPTRKIAGIKRFVATSWAEARPLEEERVTAEMLVVDPWFQLARE